MPPPPVCWPLVPCTALQHVLLPLCERVFGDYFHKFRLNRFTLATEIPCPIYGMLLVFVPICGVAAAAIMPLFITSWCVHCVIRVSMMRACGAEIPCVLRDETCWICIGCREVSGDWRTQGRAVFEGLLGVSALLGPAYALVSCRSVPATYLLTPVMVLAEISFLTIASVLEAHLAKQQDEIKSMWYQRQAVPPRPLSPFLNQYGGTGQPTPTSEVMALAAQWYQGLFSSGVEGSRTEAPPYSAWFRAALILAVWFAMAPWLCHLLIFGNFAMDPPRNCLALNGAFWLFLILLNEFACLIGVTLGAYTLEEGLFYFQRSTDALFMVTFLCASDRMKESKEFVDQFHAVIKRCRRAEACAAAAARARNEAAPLTEFRSPTEFQELQRTTASLTEFQELQQIPVRVDLATVPGLRIFNNWRHAAQFDLAVWRFRLNMTMCLAFVSVLIFLVPGVITLARGLSTNGTSESKEKKKEAAESALAFVCQFSVLMVFVVRIINKGLRVNRLKLRVTREVLLDSRHAWAMCLNMGTGRRPGYIVRPHDASPAEMEPWTVDIIEYNLLYESTLDHLRDVDKPFTILGLAVTDRLRNSVLLTMATVLLTPLIASGSKVIEVFLADM